MTAPEKVSWPSKRSRTYMHTYSKGAEDTHTSQGGHVMHYMASPLVTAKCTWRIPHYKKVISLDFRNLSNTQTHTTQHTYTHSLHLLQFSQCSVDVFTLLHIQLICIHSMLEDVWSGREGATSCLTGTLQCCCVGPAVSDTCHSITSLETGT